MKSNEEWVADQAEAFAYEHEAASQILVPGVAVTVDATDRGDVIINVETYDELRELRLVVDGQCEWHFQYGEDKK